MSKPTMSARVKALRDWMFDHQFDTSRDLYNNSDCDECEAADKHREGCSVAKLLAETETLVVDLEQVEKLLVEPPAPAPGPTDDERAFLSWAAADMENDARRGAFLVARAAGKNWGECNAAAKEAGEELRARLKANPLRVEPVVPAAPESAASAGGETSYDKLECEEQMHCTCVLGLCEEVDRLTKLAAEHAAKVAELEDALKGAQAALQSRVDSENELREELNRRCNVAAKERDDSMAREAAATKAIAQAWSKLTGYDAIRLYNGAHEHSRDPNGAIVTVAGIVKDQRDDLERTVKAHAEFWSEAALLLSVAGISHDTPIHRIKSVAYEAKFGLKIRAELPKLIDALNINHRQRVDSILELLNSRTPVTP